MVRSGSPVGAALRSAIDALRGALGDPGAAIAVVTPMRANAQLAQRSLIDTGSFIRVSFTTPEALVMDIGRFAEREHAPHPEPPGWLEATLAARLPALADAGRLGWAGETLRRPIWIPTLVEALRTLDGAGVDPAVLAALDVSGEDLAPLAGVLATLLAEVREARRAEGLRGPGETAAAALRTIEEGRLPVAARFSGFVVLGDGVLSHGVFTALRGLLARTPTRRVAIAPFDHIAPAPLGLRLAAGDAPVDRAEAAGEGALDHVRANLFGPSLVAGPDDDSLVLAATPDEVREIPEAIRVVQRAIAAGSPLERIAIALPDNAQAHVLEDALARAHIPASWLVGPPLARTTPARFLALALALTEPEPHIQAWYELLRHPGVLSEMRRLGYSINGSGRWRRMLSRSGASRGTGRLLAALARAPGDGGGVEPGDHLDDPNEIAARDSLIATITRFSGELAAWPKEGTLSRFARALLGLLERHQPPSPTRAQLERLLRSWGGTDLGPTLTAAQASALLGATLESTQALSGKLTERTVRVAPPMALLGGDFDVVCVLGLTEGRFPSAVREHPLLPDRLVAALDARFEAPRIPPSGHLADAERRRFAATVAAARGRLWLSSPRSDLLEARPAVPSALMLEVASSRSGARASYATLVPDLVVAGGRDVFAPADARDATHAVEHLLALPRADALALLAGHPHARRLLALYRAIDRLHAPPEGEAPVIDPWSGLVDPTLVAHDERLQGGPGVRTNLADAGPVAVSAWHLGRAIASPAEYFFRDVLGAVRPAWLSGRNAPTDKWTLARWLKASIERVIDSPGDDLDASFEAAWEAVSSEALRHRPLEDHDEAAAALELARARWRVLRDEVGDLRAATRRDLDGLPLGDPAALPWRLVGTSARVAGAELHAFDEEKQPTRTNPHKLVALGLQVLALAQAGVPVATPVLHDVEGTEDGGSGWSIDQALADARGALDRMRDGRWPVAGKTFRLHREPEEASS